MKIAFILRKHHTPNLFREIILNSISTFKKIDIIICSGFFSEGKRYQLTASEPHFGPTIKAKGHKLTTVGVYGSFWRNTYVQFVSNMRKIIGYFPAYKTKKSWHAKIFFLKKKSKYLITIIGSSNMTSRAFGTLKPFNVEGDVIIWNEKNKIANSIVTKNIDEMEPTDYIIANQDEKDPLDLKKKLQKLEEDIFESGILEEI